MVRNITLSADEILIGRARERALRERSSLNAAFREWLARYVAQDVAPPRYEELMERLAYARAGRSFSRDELNER